MSSRLAAAAVVCLALLPYRLPAEPVVGGNAISIDNFSFASAVVTVAAGTTVTWTNHDDIPHTVTADDGPPPSYRSHALDTGGQFAQMFAKAGIYHYFCSLHPKMRGTVVVR